MNIKQKTAPTTVDYLFVYVHYISIFFAQSYDCCAFLGYVIVLKMCSLQLAQS